MVISDLARQKFEVEQFPRSKKYDPAWVHKNEMGPNALWLAESLSQVMVLEPGIRVLDMGCGTAMSSIFLAKEFDLEIWATDLWIDPSDNLERIKEAGVDDQVFPIYAEARALPYADSFFDAIVSLDSYHYYGTDVHYLEFHLLKKLKPGGQIGIVSPASPIPVPTPRPSYLGDEWYWLNSVDWWAKLWAQTPGLTLELAEPLPLGWELWLRWHEFLDACGSRNRPDETSEYEQLLQDQGQHLGFVRMVGRRMQERSVH